MQSPFLGRISYEEGVNERGVFSKALSQAGNQTCYCIRTQALYRLKQELILFWVLLLSHYFKMHKNYLEKYPVPREMNSLQCTTIQITFVCQIRLYNGYWVYLLVSFRQITLDPPLNLYLPSCLVITGRAPIIISASLSRKEVPSKSGGGQKVREWSTLSPQELIVVLYWKILNLW